MIYITSVSQMHAAEEQSENTGVTRVDLMRNAAQSIFGFLSEYLGSVRGKSFALLCGPGNNGGDGMELAALLAESGADPLVLLTETAPSTETARACMSRHSINIPTALCGNNPDAAKAALSSADVILDCVYGTGFHGELPKIAAMFFSFVNTRCDCLKISVDIPSGINGDSGRVSENFFRPDITLALGAMKTGLVNYPACDCCGTVRVLDIGLTEQCWQKVDGVLSDESVLSFLPPRPRSANKGVFGKVLNVAGSGNYIGAALLSSKAALRAGAGLVTLASVKRVVNAAAVNIPECVFLTLPQDSSGFIDRSAAQLLSEPANESSAISIGCGIGNTDDSREIVRRVLKSGKCPVIIDADGINCVCGNINVLKDNDRPIILTPHPGEFARLISSSPAVVQSNRLYLALDFAIDTGTVVVLKGYYTVIASPDGRAYVNTTGSNALAKAGSGDVLTGIIASLCAQGVKPFEAAALGVYLHGLCADYLTKSVSPFSVLASDVIDALGKILR